MMYAGALFLPPIPLDFTLTAHSKLLPGAFVAVAYLIWRPFFCRGGVFHFSTLKRLLPLAIGFYVFGHAMNFVFEGNYLVALNELQWLVYLIAPLLMAWDAGPPGANYIVKALIACLGIESILAVISSFTGPMYGYVVLWYGPRFGTGVFRAVGTMDSTNSLGGMMAFGALVCIFAPASVLPVRRALMMVGLLAGVIFSQSKSAFFSVPISSLVVCIAGRRWRRMGARDLLSVIGSLGLVLVLVGSLFYFYGDAVADNMSRDYVERTSLSERVIVKIAEFDWLQTMFGVGFHGVDYVDPGSKAWITAHDSYINLLSDLGICGFVLVNCLFVVMVTTMLRDGQWHLLAGLLGFLLHFVTEAYLFTPLFIMTLGTLYGLTCVYQRAPKRGASSRHLELAFGRGSYIGFRA
jgi:hypothetical protein